MARLQSTPNPRTKPSDAGKYSCVWLTISFSTKYQFNPATLQGYLAHFFGERTRDLHLKYEGWYGTGASWTLTLRPTNSEEGYWSIEAHTDFLLEQISQMEDDAAKALDTKRILDTWFHKPKENDPCASSDRS